MQPNLASPSLLALLTLGTLGALSAPALADRPAATKRVAERATPVVVERTTVASRAKPKLGESFALKERRVALPTTEEAEVSGVRTLRADEIRDVIARGMSDVEYCWLKLPADRRIAGAAMLHLTVDPIGTVASARVEGSVPAGVRACIAKVAARWHFPACDTRSEIEHGITLTSRKPVRL